METTTPSVDSSDLEVSSGEDTAKSTDDLEVRVAKEMALAIQQNPKLTPAELKELQLKTSQAMQQQPKPAKSPLLKQLSKNVKSSVKKAFKGTSSQSLHDRKSLSESERRSLGDVLEEPTLSEEQPAEEPPAASGFTLNNLLGTTSNPPPTTPTGSIRITGIVWKRRSGLGKYSTTAAWERRRVILRGTRLYYYRTNVDHKDGGDDNMSQASTNEDGMDEIHEEEDHPPTEEPTPTKSKSWILEQMGNVTKTSTNKKDARGYLDLVKENAFVGASLGHTGAPTPFALSIKVLAQTKWKLCFDTRAELMQWLAALTDVIVQGSVDSYNAQILAANDPSKTGESNYHGQLSEPPLIANSGTQSNVGGHRLWVGGHYKIQSENYLDDGLEGVMEGELEDVQSDDDEPGTTRSKTTGGDPANDLILELDGGRDIWGIPANQLYSGFMLWNLAIILSRSSSTTVEIFWYLLIFANFSLFGLLNKETVGGRITPSMLVSPKMRRRLSAGMGIPVAAVKEGKAVDKKAPTKALQKQAPVIKPRAGSTTMRIENAMDVPVNKDGHVFAGWRYAQPSMMKIRSHNYKKDKVKVPSPGDMYECVHVDIFESRNRFPDMASRIQLPETSFDDEGPKTWNAPDTFVVSIAIPTDPPKLYSATDDGGGYTITVYFRMRPETREILKRVTADGYDPQSEVLDDINKSQVNAVRLLDEWCRRAPTDDAFCARFKVLPNAQNLKEIGLPAWISKYNGKPFLIKRPGQTGFLYKHPDKSCVEFDISLHPFPYLAKQGINFMKDTYFKKVLVTFGFLIEGRAEDELPECLIGLMQLCYPDPVHAIQGEDLMAGKSASSFE